MDENVKEALQFVYDLLDDKDSDAYWLAMFEEAAASAGSKDPNEDVWFFLQNCIPNKRDTK